MVGNDAKMHARQEPCSVDLQKCKGNIGKNRGVVVVSSSASPTHHRPISKIDTQLPEINLNRAGDVEFAPAECVQEHLNVFLCNDGRVERCKLKDVKDTYSSENERGVVNGVACFGIRI